MKKIFICFSIILLSRCEDSNGQLKSGASARPNILLIVADDLGYTDLGCYGGEIHTPNIDALAANGVLFNNFHTSPICAPTRSMILSGNDNHIAGIGSMFSVAGTPRQNRRGYEGHLSDRIVTVAQLLKDGGYQTFMAGKWHIGSDAAHIPFAQGFERSFALLPGAANHFSNVSIFDGVPTRFQENNQAGHYPVGRFSTDVYTEKMMAFIKDAKTDKPFFAYLTYTAPHWPLQVPNDYLDKYRGRYDIGYDSLRVLRFQHQKEKGLIPTTAQLPPRLSSIKPWINLSAEEKKIEARKMELYAAMVENLDEHIGRLVKFLKEINQYDNTLIVFMSDNGAAAEDFYNDAEFGAFLRKNFDNSYENMGKATSFVSYGPQWAQAGAAPFKLFKEYPTEGGTRTPLIISGRYLQAAPGIREVFINVMDLAPGFLELANLSYPESYHGKRIAPMLGQSFIPFLQGKTAAIHNENYVYGLEHYGGCLLIKGNWKITNISDPFDETAFALYNLDEDRGETNDLSKSNQKKYKEMINEWEMFKKRVGVIPLEKREQIHLDILK